MIPQLSDRRVVTYGFSPQADVRGVNVERNAAGAHFDVRLAEHGGSASRVLEDLDLPMLGAHNVQNALAAIAIGISMDLPDATLRKGLAEFTGVKRRFMHIGEAGGIAVIDDYGHHPVEIAAVLDAARNVSPGRVIAVVQPHRYSRVSALFEDFCTCFNDADTVLIADIYAAGETPIEGVDRDALVEGLRAHGHRDARPLVDPELLATTVLDVAASGDMVVCLGAGNITAWAQALPAQMEQRLRAPTGTES